MNSELALRLCDELDGVLRSMDEELQQMSTLTPRQARAAWTAINWVTNSERIPPNAPNFVRRVCQYGHEWGITEDQVRGLLELPVRYALQLMGPQV